ncbi:four-carbon acid sugar kinase family protein [Azospirillum oleiclasticum]|uniref:four-carbon acid sugar kinase family protein n=1 Tax=Azospirillum oleiclasticum TaxID=2735135 RepID=UPI001B3B8CE7
MTPLRLIADDLTGALDTAVWFAGPADPVPVHWGAPATLLAGSSIAIDSGTREAGLGATLAATAALAARLHGGPDTLLYAKLDSLLRGHAAAAIAGWVEAVNPARCIIAPAFPLQGRVTRGGVQQARLAGGWQPVGAGFLHDLEREGLSAALCRPGDAVPPGVSLWDAETDTDLAAIAAAGLLAGAGQGDHVLWCGSGGLAAALAGRLGRAVPVMRAGVLPSPILGLFGTDHPVTDAQLSACASSVLALPDAGEGGAAALAERLAGGGAVLARPSLPDGLPREAAAGRIADWLDRLARRLPPPGTLIVAGGETLRALCRSLGAERLDLDGQIEAGVPCSVLRGGRWNGVRVVSKSGAFGDPQLLRRLIAAAVPSTQGDPA